MPEFALELGDMDARRIFHNLDSFTQGYVTAMFFTSTGTGDDEDLEEAAFAELAPETLATIIADCEKFQRGNNYHLDGLAPDDEEKAGRDFWYTRCGHGCGFWDGDWPEPAASDLTQACKDFRSLDLYRGDDRQLYLA